MRITKKEETPATKYIAFRKRFSSKNIKEETLFPSYAHNFFFNHAKTPFISMIVLFLHFFKT
ncbi:hypothetical protein CN475_23075 [Bacillus cereus]|uniref:Uncharacterized protein n=1 Tax=Bacillus cereus TaxID=1396 RepID=A0A9X6YQC8_BACCE|nr:hypothetical protein CN475_23075 [Bacillus cereus]